MGRQIGVYYNEFDPFAADWLRELIRAKQIPDGDVDDRSITEVTPKDLKNYTQCHFFAGIGGWALALKDARWGNAPVWTGSCPCQPFSSSGKQEGIADARHLWPAFYNLIRECNPPVVFGEQVATAIAKGWLDIVFADLEREGYACGAAVFGAHSVGGPHIRQRLYWLGDGQYRGSVSHKSSKRDRRVVRWTGEDGDSCRIPNPTGQGSQGATGASIRKQTHDKLNHRQDNWTKGEAVLRSANSSTVGRRGEASFPEGNGFWKNWEWLLFRDGKRRPVEPGTFPLANGVPQRVGRLRGYGNALCVPSAKAFVSAYLGIYGA